MTCRTVWWLSHCTGFTLALSLAASRGALSADSAAPASTDRLRRDLAIGSRVEAELKPGEQHLYRVLLHAPRCAKIVATQSGIDVKIALRPPDGAEPAEEDQRSSGDEALLVIPPRDGLYELLVSTTGAHVPPGRYWLLVEETPADDAYRSACQHQIGGRALSALGKERLGDARKEFEAASSAWDGLDERAMAAYSLFEIGRISKRLTELDAAKDAFTESARRFGGLGQIADQAAAQNSLGETLVAVGDFRAACALWKSTFALEDSLTPGDRVQLRYNYGSTLKELGDYQESLDAVQHAIAAFHDLGMTVSELNARTELASTYIMQRDPVHALEELNRGVALSHEAARPDMEARFLQRLGLVYWEAGDDDTAAEQWRRALTLHRDAGNRIGEGAVLLQLGDCKAFRGDSAAASVSYQEALDIFLAAGSKLGEARALTRLGNVLAKRGEYNRAVELQQRALDIDHAQGAQQSEVNALVNLARTKSEVGERAEARRLLTTALSLSHAAAADFGETQILGGLALLDRDEGATTRALATLETVLGKLEAEQRAALVPSLQATFSGDAQLWYAARTDILMSRHLAAPRAGWDAKGLESAERARARTLLSLLAESHADIRKGVEPALLERYRSLQVQLSTADQARGERSGTRGGSALAEGEREIDELTNKIHSVETKIRRASPSYAALTQPSPIDVDAIRKRVLDSDTVLIEYALGEKRSWLWAITKGALVSAPLPPAEEIEGAAQRLYRSLSARPSGGAASGAETEAAELSRLLLQPIAKQLSGPWRGRRLAIVSAGALEYVPFGVLPVPGSGSPEYAASAHRLIDDHEIVSLPSASVLDLMRRELVGRPPAPLRLALVGDPVFGSDDPRVRREPASTAALHSAVPLTRSADVEPGVVDLESPPDPISRAALVAGGTRGFPRLPFSRDEVRAIAALLPEGEAFKATDFRASRALATEGALGRYRILHIATHGLLNTAHPELSGLVLSLVDENGRAQDGFLRLQDIYNLHLGADLVVLSACRTALGRQISGEGLVGLTRGFMYAGAPRVLASLWQVDDSATADLMTEFYRGIFHGGLRPAAALRAAQRKLAADPRWSAPFFWAGFTLEGDWR